MTMSELYKLLDCIFYTACFEGIADRREWWYSKVLPIDWMITCLGSDLRTSCKLSNWPMHYKLNTTIASTMSTNGKLYSRLDNWLNKYCPGLMCDQRKLRPFGNKYHIICDCNLVKDAPIMFCVELAEWKYRPVKQPKEFEDCGKTLGLMFCMSLNLWKTGKVVMMDYGFSVSKDILAMREKGVFGQALIKPRIRGWPVLIPGIYILMNNSLASKLVTLRHRSGLWIE